MKTQSHELPRICLPKETKTCPREIAEKLDELTGNLRRVLFVVINGAGINVGKSYVKTLVMRHLYEQRVPTVSDSHLNTNFSHSLRQLEAIFNSYNSLAHPGVIVSDNTHYLAMPTIEMTDRLRKHIDMQLRENSGGILEKVDLWIGVERPDKLFKDIPIADVLIHNLGAKNKPA